MKFFRNLCIALYLYAAFWTGVFAVLTAPATFSKMQIIGGSVVMAVLWPAALPLHVYDFK